MTSWCTCTQAWKIMTATMPMTRARVSLRASFISLRVAGADAELLDLAVGTQEAVDLLLDREQPAHLAVDVVRRRRRVGERRVGQAEIGLDHGRAVERGHRFRD